MVLLHLRNVQATLFLFLLCMCTGGLCTESEQRPWVSFLKCPLLIFALRQDLSLALAPNFRHPPVSSTGITSLCQYAWLFHMAPEVEIQFPRLARQAHYQHSSLPSPQAAVFGERCRNKFSQPQILKVFVSHVNVYSSVCTEFGKKWLVASLLFDIVLELQFNLYSMHLFIQRNMCLLCVCARFINKKKGQSAILLVNQLILCKPLTNTLYAH